MGSGTTSLPAARLAQATSALPGQIGARAAELRKGEQAARHGSSRRASGKKAMESNIKLSERQLDLLRK